MFPHLKPTLCSRIREEDKKGIRNIWDNVINVIVSKNGHLNGHKKSVLYRNMKDQLLPHLLISHPKICITHPLFLAFPKAVEKEICSMSYNAIY